MKFQTTMRSKTCCVLTYCELTQLLTHLEAQSYADWEREKSMVLFGGLKNLENTEFYIEKCS